MVLFFSGGGTPWLPERTLKRAGVMLSYYVDGGRGKPGPRYRSLEKAKKPKGKGVRS